jgi:hypothetical protein
MEEQLDYSNIITPPDFVDENKFTVLIIDAESNDIQNLGLFLKNSDNYFNIYLYHSEMGDEDWFANARNRADAFIINTKKNTFSTIKDILAELPNAYYYGKKKFLKNKNSIKSPVDFFINYNSELK